MVESRFTGFPAEAIAFLRDLEAHNDREWFKANRHRYDDHLLAPARALGEALRDLGRPHTFRPYNDTRFHARPPIKEHLGLAIGYEGAGGYYVEVSLDGLFLAAGLHNPTRDQLERMRAAMADGRKAASLSRAIERAGATGMALGEPELKRAPKGYDPAHPRIELLRRRSLVVTRREPLAKWLHGRGAERRIRERLDACTPLVSWIRNHVGPPQHA